ncbi:MAG: hypothetical protein ABFD49_01425 [Armatimonadota bacterium]|nr:hypothetical protein [bacterium]
MRANITAFVLALVILISGAAAADKAITGINVANKSDRVIITVQGNSALNMSCLKSAKGKFIGFQFPCALTAKGRLVGIRSGKIYNVRYSNFSSRPAATRVVVNTNGHVQYSTEWSADKNRVEITVWKNGKPKDNVTPAVQTQIPEPESAAIASIDRPADNPPAMLRTQTLALYASANTKAMPTASAKPIEPVTRVLGEAQEIAQKPAAKHIVLARVDTPTIGRLAQDVEKRVSLNFLGADINDVLKALSMQSGHNIVAGKDVTGNVTVSLSDVSMDEAMNYVAKLSGYSYVKNNSTYLVGSQSTLAALTNGEQDKPVERVVDVIRLYYANVDETAMVLSTEFPDLKFSLDTSKFESDKNKKTRGGFLMVSGPSNIIKKAKAAASNVDDEVGRLLGEVTEIYKVKYVDAAELKETIEGVLPGLICHFGPGDDFNPIMSSTIAGTSMVSPLMPNYKLMDRQLGPLNENGGLIKETKTVDRMTKPQTITITGTKPDVQKALELAAKLDVRSPQISIEAKITCITKSGAEQLGVEWSWDAISFLEDVTAPLIVTDKDLDAEVAISENVSVDKSLKRWFRQPVDFSATLDALVTNGNATVLASPNLTCVEGKPGKFFVGDEVTYVSSVSASSGGEKTYETDTKQAGVALSVIGNVSEDSYITLNLHPEVSSITLTTTDSVTVPTVSRRYTDQIVRVKNGSTIAIGGLIRNDEIETMSKIPFLGDLPFFGQLFRHKSTSSEKNEVVMFITAKIVED